MNECRPNGGGTKLEITSSTTNLGREELIPSHTNWELETSVMSVLCRCVGAAHVGTPEPGSRDLSHSASQAM